MVSAIIVASGRGRRMNQTIPKQYLMLGDMPVLAHTLMPFDRCGDIDNICLVVPEQDMNFCRQNILSRLTLKTPVIFARGGAERQHSVYNGLTAVQDGTEIVLIHDGVRPFLQPEQIAACIRKVRECGACILGIPASDTIKQTDHSGCIVNTFERKGLWLAQTPQAFQYDMIRAAHEYAREQGYIGTDDAVLAERMGKKVEITPGSRLNIKITTPEDLIFAEYIVRMSDSGMQRQGMPCLCGAGHRRHKG